MVTNTQRYANQVMASSPEQQAWHDAKYAYEQAVKGDVSDDIRQMLREELDMAAEACEYAYRSAYGEAREHYA